MWWWWTFGQGPNYNYLTSHPSQYTTTAGGANRKGFATFRGHKEKKKGLFCDLMKKM
jgi:hypothetical protein